jgi:mRNA interferase RelE/StbE
MKYQLVVESRAKKDIQSLNVITQKRIAKKIKYFLDQSDPLLYAKKLVDSSGGDYRFRIGNYRAIFDIEDNKIKLLRVQHRKDIYKR